MRPWIRDAKSLQLLVQSLVCVDSQQLCGSGLAVDGSGQLPSGKTFEDEQGLKQLLVDRKEQFAEALTEKLLTYATGRSMTFRDQADIKQVAAECGNSGYGLRDLVAGVVRSGIFRQR
jgi:hypothetical protein